MTNHDKEACWLLFFNARQCQGLPIDPARLQPGQMTSETQNLRLRLQSLTTSFSDLEEQLQPLFTQSLPETLVGLEPIQQAKLQTALAYVVYDLIFGVCFCDVSCDLNSTWCLVYLKAKGINPKTHPVISELVSCP